MFEKFDQWTKPRVQTATIHSHNTAKYCNMFALWRTRSKPKWPGWFQVPSLILLLYLMNRVDIFLCNRKHWLHDFHCCAFINLVIDLCALSLSCSYSVYWRNVSGFCVSRCLTFSTLRPYSIILFCLVGPRLRSLISSMWIACHCREQMYFWRWSRYLAHRGLADKWIYQMTKDNL